MKRALRALLSFAVTSTVLFITSSNANAQCPVVLDSIVAVDVTCSGANDGSIAIYVSGGFPNYTYQIFNPPAAPQFFTTSAMSHVFTGLNSGSGDYQVIVVGEDGVGGNCSPVFDFVTVNDPPPFTISVSTTNDTCPDANVGTAVVDVTGGVAPYTYSWPPFLETSDSISGLDGGNYSVTVTDANSCPQSENFTIVSPPDWSGTLTGSNPTCFGATDGSITSSGITGGTPPYSFSWTGSAQTTENLSGLGVGSYSLTVTDDIGCTRVFPTVILTQPTELIITETHVDVSCDGLGDGSIDVSVSGGVAPYTYLWTNGATTQDITGLSSGNYILTVTDDVGCSDNISVTILDGSNLSLSSISVSSQCGDSDGSIDLTVTGGSGNYGYSWQPGGQTTQDLTGIPAGIYDVIVTDNTIGCIDSLTVIVNNFPGHTATGVVTDGANCVSNDGSIDVTVVGGSGDFSYLWSHGPTTEDVSGLPTGTYFITVTDNIVGCIYIAAFNVSSGNEVDVTTSVTQPTCGLINGVIDLTVSGGTPPYSYLWSSGAITQDISGVGPGVYSVTVTDDNGCPFDTTFTLSNQAAPVITETANDPLCSDSFDGSISLSVSGGIGPYTYSWSTGASSSSISGLSGGTYNVTVVDQATGCTANESYTLTSPPGFNGFVNITHVSCGGASDGAIDGTITGGTPPYTFLWTPGNYTTLDITNLTAGTYTVVFSDDNGCGGSAAFDVTEPPTLVVSETHVDVSCNGDDDGSIDVSVSGGTPGYTYLWQPGGETTQDLSGLGPGTYEVVVTDAGGCSDSVEVDIIEPALLTLASSSTDATCNGSCDGTATATPSGGTAPYTFVWTPNVSSGPNATGLCAGTYDVIVTDDNGCQETESFTISDIVVDLTLTTTNITCNGTCDGTGSTVVTGTNPPFTYDWQPSGGNGPSASGLCAGNYTLTVEDATGCSVTEPFTIIDPDPIVISMAVTDVSCEGLSDGAIDLTVTGGVGPYTYQWFPLGQTTEDISGLPAGDYSIVVTDANGCTSSAITLGGSFSGGTLYLPDGNGDSYTTAITVTGFPAGATLVAASDFQGVCLNMEHSYLGDLDIQLTCPNGTTVDLVQSIGIGIPGSTFLGDAADGTLGIPGVGWEYCWTPTPTYGTMDFEATSGNTVPVSLGVALPAGDYTSVESLGNFVGCPMNGDWTITVTDNFAIDDGFIFDWGVTFNGVGSNDSLATVNEPGPITSTSNVTDANCGSCDGEITVIPAGGNAPYTYLWNTGATTATISNLCAGVYNVIVTDANGCMETFFIPVDHIDGPTGANTTIVDASCFGLCDGEATVEGIGGAPPYTYQWVPGGFTTNAVTGLCAGTYNVQIQDSLNCIYTEPVVIGEPAEIFIGQTVVNSLCGSCNGEIDLSPISGQAPFTYVWSPAVSTDSVATGLCAGVYNITVTDATGCESVVTSLVNDIPSPSLTMTGIDPLCNDSCNGDAIVTPIGGTPPFTYLWDDPSGQTDSIASGLCAGLYTATITDDNGCVAVNQITLSEPDPIGLSLLIIDNGTCAGNCDGSITVIPSGGTIPFTYLWDDPFAQTTAAAIDLCAGTYNVQVTDANGCTDVTSGTVNNPVGLTATATGTDVSCNGVCDGSAYVTPVGGTPPFTYLWDDPAGQVSDTAIGLCAGSYTVTVTDINGCDFIAPVTISEPDPIVITFSGIVGLQCDGECIGEATADVTGGTAPYTYSWDDALTQNTATADSLCASTYTVTVTDANGCVETAVVTITGPNGLTSSIISQTGTSCNGDCDGSAVAAGSGGTAPYTYQWNDLANTTNDTVTGLCAGIYSVTVTDDNGCVSVSTVVIDEPDVLAATTTADDVSCFGECDGEATAFTLGGTFPYTYQWNDPANQTTLTAVGLCPGPYEVEITDVNGCVATAPVTIFEPTEITIDSVIVDATCGLCNGEITVIPDGGVPGYTYLWGNGETTATISGLCPGVYTVDVTDAIGCTVNFDIAVSNLGGPTSATISVTDASCFGICDGEATVTPSGGTAPYTYLWVPGGYTTSTVSGLCAGAYNVQIIDAEGCIYTQLVTVNEPDEIVSNANTTQATCGACNGEILLAPTGGDGGPYTYAWVPAVSVNDTASGLCAGIYTVTITDGNACETIAIIPITNQNAPILTTSTTDATCDGECNGTGTVVITGGTPPYTILWDDPSGQTDPTANGLCAGIYNVTVTDDNGCVAIAQIEIEDPDPISLSLQLVVDATCAGVCDGSATVVASGGTLPFSYDWAPTGGSSNTATGLCAGTYTVTVTDANLCQTQQTVVVDELQPQIAIDTIVTDATCGICNGEITVIPNGGVPGYDYLWGNGETTSTISNLCAAVYTVDVTDSLGCSVNFDIPVSNIGGPTSATVSVTDASCFGVCDGEATVTPDDGTAPFSYLWIPGGYTTSNVSGLCAGSYNVQIIDSAGCIFTQLVTINQPSEIVSNSNVTQATCGLCNGEIVLNPTGGDSGPYTYSWAPPVSVNETASSLCAGIYTVTITDGSGCESIETIPIGNIDGPTLSVTGTDATCDGECNGTGTVVITGGTPPYTILWDDPSGQTDPTANGLCAGIYNVTVTDDNGCVAIAQIEIEDPDPISLSLQLVVDATCAGVCDGSATVVASGGTLPFSYDWAPTGGSSNTATGLCAGTYTVTVTDANLCQTQQTVVVDELQPQIAIDTIVTDATCGICNGEITVIPNGGVPGYDYLWGNGETTSTISNLCAAVYTVDVTDSLGCSVNFDIPVSNIGGPTSATVSVTDASCFGVCDGEATVTPDDGTAPFSYLWIPGGYTTSNVSGLCAGSYNVQIIDSAGCIFTQLVTINQPSEIVSNSNVTQATCGLCNGEIVLNPTGGDSGPYTYSWAPPVSVNETASSLCAGIYTVTITDGSGCESIETIPIGNIDGPTLSVTGTDATCDGVCDGSATVTILGGTAPFTILWDDPSGQTDPTATGLCAGTYNVTVTDDNGCQSVAQVIIEDPDPISISIPFVQDASCPGVCDGSATVVASGGTLPFTYDWAPTGGSSSTATGLCAGTYTVTVTDANGCTEQETVTINEPPAIIIDTNTLDASCNGLCDGEAYAEATGGSGGFTYQWNDLANTANDTVTGLCAGTYTIVVTDMAGCMDSVDVTINEPDSISIAVTVEGVGCAGDCDGSAIAIAAGGNAPYTYQWNDPNTTMNDTVSDLCAGIYSLVVTDSLGCTQTSAIVITEPLPLTLLDSAIHVTCGGTCDGAAGVLPLGGTEPYTYQWDDPDNSTTPFIIDLCAGVYQVIVTDANGCMDSTSITITEPPVLDITVSVQNPSCGGVCDGEATVTINGGTGPFGILWLPGLEITPTITGLCAGQYTVIVVDAGGCADTAVVDLTEPPLLEADITAVTQVLCSSGCTGEATVTPTGGTAPFTYLWNDPSGQTDSTATGLCVGIWSVVVTDDIGCTANATTVITDSAALVAAIPIFTPVTCNGECDGTATVFASGGIGPYTYSWDDPFSQATQTAIGLCPGTYTVTVVDSQSPACTTQASVTILEPLELTAAAIGTDVTCGTDCDGSALAVPLGGTPPYQFSWNDPANQGTIEATDLCVGTYTVTITDLNGCTAQASATVNGPPAIVSNASTVASTCSNAADGSIDLTVAGGVPGYDYDWVPGDFETEDLSNIEFGTYTVTITDATGCSITATYSVGTLVNIDANAGVNDTVCVGTSILLNGTGGGEYLWTPSATLSDSAVADPIATPFDTTTYYLTVTIGSCVDIDSVTIYTYQVPPVDGGDDLTIPTGSSIGLNANGVVTGWTYTWEPSELLDNPNITNPVASPEETTMFYVTVIDENGCSSTDSVLVEVTPGIEFPDGISPNGDGINDTWRIDNIDLFDDAIVEVYNRWGQLLFQSAPGYPVPWDGRYKGEDLPVGTYYYVIYSANFEDPFTGPITIVR